MDWHKLIADNMTAELKTIARRKLDEATGSVVEATDSYVSIVFDKEAIRQASGKHVVGNLTINL